MLGRIGSIWALLGLGRHRRGWTLAALLALGDEVISPILASNRSLRQGRRPATWTPVDRDYEALRIDMHNLFQHLHLDTVSVAA